MSGYTINVGGVEYRPCDIPPGAIQAAAGTTAVQADGQPIEPPAHSALKAEWVAFAVESGLSEDEARSLTKDELVARFGS